MEDGVGLGLIVSGSVLGLAAAFLFRARLPAWTVASMLAVCGGMLGAGALLVQADVGVADWAVTVTALCVLTPLHVWVLLGPLERPSIARVGPGP